MAPREGFEPPRPMDSGFQIHRNTGLCDLGRILGSSATVISMAPHHAAMQVRFHGRDHNMEIECDEGTSVREALAAAGVLASTVIVSHDGVVLPHATLLNADVALLVTTVSSGG